MVPLGRLGVVCKFEGLANCHGRDVNIVFPDVRDVSTVFGNYIRWSQPGIVNRAINGQVLLMMASNGFKEG